MLHFILEALGTPPSVDFTSLVAVLTWLSGVGCVYATNWLFGKILAGVRVWNALPSWVKWVVPPTFSVLVGLGANYLLSQELFLAKVAPLFAAVVTILIGYFGSQVAHNQSKVINKPTVMIVTRPDIGQNRPDQIDEKNPADDSSC